MEAKLNLSGSPHVRSKLSTGRVMLDVIIALMPATVLGVVNFGLHALWVVLVSVLTAVATETVFNLIVRKKNTVSDLSAVVTGLMLALCLPAGVPLFVPFLGSVFAILFVKCLCGGLGKNFMNPALAGRCFLLVSFSGLMTDYVVDGVSTATPLAMMAAGGEVSLSRVFLGTTSGVIGCSALGLILGGAYLLAIGGITWEIPTSIIVSYTALMGIFGGHGFDPAYLATHLCAGGVLMGALFMATDPVTSPVTSRGHILYGIVVGSLAALFRLKGNVPDSVSFTIIFANLIVPFLDMLACPKPFAYRKEKKRSGIVPKSALILCAITLVSGLALSGVRMLTKDTIEAQKNAAKAESYRVVCADAQSFDEMDAALDGGIYGTDFGRVIIKEALTARNADGEICGYIFGVTSKDGVEGDISLTVGLSTDGTVTGVAFTELNETAGLGSLCGEDAFKNQFLGVKTSAFVLNKGGTASADNEINSVSGASVSSEAVVNAVNAAIDFYNNNVG